MHPNAPRGPLGLEETLAAAAPQQTLRPHTQAADLRRLAGRDPVAISAAWEESLPRLSLGATTTAEGNPAAGPDLEIRGTLGEGGMGRVLLAWQRSLGREVAVKTLKGPTATEDARLMLLREGLIAGSLEHPGVVPVHSLGLSRGGEPLLVTKRVDGISWRELLRDHQHPLFAQLPGGSADPLHGHLFILMQVCNALHFAHSRGVIHRDIKPDNVMVGAFGEVYVLDWGIATRLPPAGELRTNEHELVGTPVYMAPEMVSAAAGPIDARTDVYLLGATLHEVLTGAPRHPGASAAEVLRVALESRPPSYGADVPAELGALCLRATSAAPEERPPSALAFRQALEVYLQHRGSERIAADAQQRLAELRRQLAVGGARAERAQAQRLAIECRLAFRMALQSWPESPAAQAGLLSCVTLLCEDALAERRTAEARALLAELPAPPAALAARVAAQEAEAQAERERDQSLRHLAREMDARVGARARLLFGAAAVCTDLAVRVFVTGFGVVPTLDQLVREIGVVLTLLVLGTIVGRRALLANAYGRRFLMGALIMVGLQLLNRLFARGTEATAPQVLRTDLFIAAGVISAMGAALHNTFYALAAVPLAAIGASVLAARAIGAIFQVSMLCVIVGGMLIHYSLAGLRAVPDPPPPREGG